jgi:hypothetical protein
MVAAFNLILKDRILVPKQCLVVNTSTLRAHDTPQLVHSALTTRVHYSRYSVSEDPSVGLTVERLARFVSQSSKILIEFKSN